MKMSFLQLGEKGGSIQGMPHPDHDAHYVALDPQRPPSVERSIEVLARALATMGARQEVILEQVIALRAKTTGDSVDEIRKEAQLDLQHRMSDSLVWWRIHLDSRQDEPQVETILQQKAEERI
jgi:hypothetical protein